APKCDRAASHGDHTSRAGNGGVPLHGGLRAGYPVADQGPLSQLGLRLLRLPADLPRMEGGGAVSFALGFLLGCFVGFVFYGVLLCCAELVRFYREEKE